MSRWLLIAAAGLVILSLIVPPWLVVEPVALPGLLQTAANTLLTTVRSLAPAPVPQVVAWLQEVSAPSAWSLLSFSFLGAWVRIAIILPLAAAGLGLLLTMVSLLTRSSEFQRAAGWVSLLGAGLAGVLLVISIPAIQRLGLGAGSVGGLLISLLGVHLAWGFWATLLSLVLFMIAGVIALNEPGPSRRPVRRY